MSGNIYEYADDSEIKRPLSVVIEALGGGGYSCRAMAGDKALPQGEFRWMPRGLSGRPLSAIGAMDPIEAGFFEAAPRHVQSALDQAETVEVQLPGDNIAALNWEGLTPTGVIRRCPTAARGWGFSGFQFPLRMAVMATEDESLEGVRARLSDALADERQNGLLAIDYFRLDNPEDIARKLEGRYYDVVHLSAPTLVRDRVCSTQFGASIEDTRTILETTLAARPRMMLYHGISDEPIECISGLRMASQAAPNLGTSCIVHCSPGGIAASYEFLGSAYLGAFSKDEGLGLPDLRRSRGVISPLMTSVVAPFERNSLLDLKPAIRIGMDLADAIKTDELAFGRQFDSAISEDSPRSSYSFGGKQPQPEATAASEEAEPQAQAGGQPDATEGSLTAELFNVTQSNEEGKSRLRRESKGASRTGDGERPRERYPIGNFCHCGEDPKDFVPIASNRTLSKPPSGRKLEFHFWIDPIKGGIKTLAADPFDPPEGTVYPIRLRARVWSEKPSLQFKSEEDEIVIPETGVSSRARFELSPYPDHEDSEFFLFLLHEATLVAAFRVFARFREQSEIDEGAQLVVQLFSSSDFFRFAERPGTSALTILLDQDDGGELRVFTFEAEGRPWAKLGIKEYALNDHNRDIYRLLTEMALEAAVAERHGGPAIPGPEQIRSLAVRGFTLLQDLFAVESEIEAFNLSERLANLQVGSRVTIATSEKTANMIVPWGLIYLGPDDFGFMDSPELDYFLGHRYNLIVRPSMPLSPAPADLHAPARVAAAWLSRSETTKLKETLEHAAEEHRLEYQPIKAQRNTLPDLEDHEFDLIHFYCHGHTRFPADFHPEALDSLFQHHVQAITPPRQDSPSELATFLQKVQGAPDSLMYLDGGFVYRANLAKSLAKLKGAPIVLLSMCESAQVTSSGSGFVTMFLRRHARAVMGTEGPTLWSLGRDLDLGIIERLLQGENIGEAFYAAKREMAQQNPLALIYSLWGDRDARIANPAAL